MNRIRLAALLAAAALLAPSLAWAGTTLDSIKQRGALRCGVNTGLIGFSAPDAQGKWHGLDVDFCRAVAAAVLGDPNKVQFVPTNTQNRFTVLQSGEVDILSRNTTWTASRDSTLGAVFAGTIFYDGQGFMVKKSANVKSASQLNGATICVQPGTTTELNLSDYFRTKKMNFRPVVVNELQQVEQAFFSGRCDVFTTDISGLAATRLKAPNRDDYVILPEAISKEPLGPLVRRGDWEYFTIVKWVLAGLIEAEEYGVTSSNVDKLKAESKDPPIQRLVGTSGDIGKGLGLDNDWLVRALKAVGNYGEMYQRNVGPIGIARGLNAQWRDGGLMYAPPIR
ncbi:MAG: amino acid ABC transporter substrate-binding protein [Burkholderiaceae bacterium]|jgi:general L-amino acid transport system substrate-binding protein|nr:amino acid ABC transporter substrate-binding protein [Burkholderiaceae bacterium]MBX3612300.1 amino acid ABC transporter substrate-binding protein [Burkholderiaceae bacterium]HMN65184.1 amino acid ABC transporter substrate-binding protein [Burkholderiaceae bacterium]